MCKFERNTFRRRENALYLKWEQTNRIWRNCELPKNTLQKHFFQNIQKNFCKNGPAKPLFMRVPRGKCRNEGRPFQGIDTTCQFLLWRCIILVEMKIALFRALTLDDCCCNFVKLLVAERKVAPSRALTHWDTLNIPAAPNRVETKVAPFRALTQFHHTHDFESPFYVEMKFALSRALTLITVPLIPDPTR